MGHDSPLSFIMLATHSDLKTLLPCPPPVTPLPPCCLPGVPLACCDLAPQGSPDTPWDRVLDGQGKECNASFARNDCPLPLLDPAKLGAEPSTAAAAAAAAAAPARSSAAATGGVSMGAMMLGAWLLALLLL
jgi:hypothetical protein